VFPLSWKKTALLALSLDSSRQKLSTYKFGRNFLRCRKFHKTQFHYFFKDLRDIFSQLKPLSSHRIESSDAIWKFSVCKIYRKKLWAQFHYLCVQKRSNFLLSSDAFWKLSPCSVYEKRSGRIFTFFASKNEAVCCEFQTHFVLCLQGLQKRFWAHFLNLMHPKTKLFSVKSRRILEVFLLQDLWKQFWVLFPDLCVQKWSGLLWNLDIFLLCKLKKKCWVHFHDLCIQKRSCLLWHSDTFLTFSSPRIVEKVLNKFSRFMCPQTKPFAAKLHTFLKLFACMFCRKSFGRSFTICVQKWSCLLWRSDGFWKVFACKIDKKVLVAFSRFMCRAKKHSWLKHFVKMLWAYFIILHVNKSLLGCSRTLKFLTFNFYQNV